mmetsp:Transcript_2953/g.6402  ORF Transcript_2953/g.6402 Transcript_2953/m.6402 type:complete len:273 (-) Transcript_2953:783-1601(-)
MNTFVRSFGNALSSNKFIITDRLLVIVTMALSCSMAFCNKDLADICPLPYRDSSKLALLSVVRSHWDLLFVMDVYFGCLTSTQSSQPFFAFSGIGLIWLACPCIACTGSTDRCKRNLLEFGLIIVNFTAGKNHQCVTRKYFNNGSREFSCTSEGWRRVIFEHTDSSTLGRILSNTQRRHISRAHHANSPIRDPSKTILQNLSTNITTGMMHRTHETNSRLICTVQRHLQLPLQQTKLNKFPRRIGKWLAGSGRVQPLIAHAGTRHTSQNKRK